jgi:hypothetical protein
LKPLEIPLHTVYVMITRWLLMDSNGEYSDNMHFVPPFLILQ